MQYWLLENKSENGDRFLYFCNADGRETAKRMASHFLLGDPDTYIVTPISNPGETVNLRINIGQRG